MKLRLNTSIGRSEEGFGLVESMIVILIILFMSLTIFTVMSSSESHKRTTASVSDADQEGNYAVYVLEKAIRNAGSGFRQGMAQAYGCTLNVAISNAQWVPTTTTSLPTLFAQLNTDANGGNYQVAPVLIDKGGSSLAGATPPRTSDALIVMSGTSGFGEFPTNLSEPAAIAPTTGALNLSGTAGFNANDLVLLTQPAAGGLQNRCALTEVASAATWPADAKGLPVNGGVSLQLPLAGTYYSPGAPGLGFQLATLTSSAQALDLGNQLTDGHPNFQLFAVAQSSAGNTTINDSLNSTLWSYDLLQIGATGATTQAVSVADSVYEMRALYGVSSATTCTPNPPGCPITSWEDPGSATWNIGTLMNKSATANTALYQIKAIRLGLILRAALPEQQVQAGTPPTQTTTVTLFNNLLPAGGTATPYTRTFNLAGEQNYRYRTIEVTIPVRNNLF